ncbi:hypothetical protein ACFX2F_046995 [Malus domestica]
MMATMAATTVATFGRPTTHRKQQAQVPRAAHAAAPASQAQAQRTAQGPHAQVVPTQRPAPLHTTQTQDQGESTQASTWREPNPHSSRA